MALYKYTTHLSQVDHAEFDKTYSPGSRAAWSGIYRCINCGHEAVHTHFGKSKASGMQGSYGKVPIKSLAISGTLSATFTSL